MSVLSEINDLIRYQYKGKFQNREWWRSNIFSELGKIQNEFDIRDNLDTYGIELGKFYFFNYSPRYPKRYKFYDIFPMSIMLTMSKNKTGEVLFLGANIHYLSPNIRAPVARNLLKSQQNVPEKCFHSYYLSEISNINRIPDSEISELVNPPQRIEEFLDKYNQKVPVNKIWNS